MPLVTGRLSWRANSNNKTLQAFCRAVRDFVVNSGNYTLITDQTTSTTNPYFVVQSTRSTGFAGDRIIAQIGATLNTGADTYLRSSPYFMFYNYAFESWSGTTGTNQASTSTATQYTTFLNTSLDCDFWISCDDKFILSMSRIYDGNYTAIAPCGVVNFERLSGDNDSGTFYGNFNAEGWGSNRRMFVPKRWDNATSTSAVFNLTTKVGSINSQNSIGLYGINESNKHVILGFNVNLPASNKIKGRVFGVGASTYGFDLVHGALLPSSASPQYIVGKPCSSGNVPPDSTCMEVASTITTITT